MTGTGTDLAIPAHLHARQTTASDPAVSIWVSANAGSGKTHVLTQRVIRLLLTGVPPARILCLTFTKAAAAQMATRVFRTLADWTRHDDEDLRGAILATGAPAPSAADLVLARRLFTRTVETPGGLKIQTIHAFCERLLHLFPFEANVPARFEVADDRRREELLSLAKHAVITDMKGSAALAIVADIAGVTRFHPLIADAMRLRAGARRAATDPQRALASRLGARGLDTVEAVRRAMIDDGLGPARWPAIAEVLDTGLATDRKYARCLREAGGSVGTGDLATAVSAYLTLFFDSSQMPRKSMMTSRLAAAHPTLAQELAAERDRLDGLRASLKIAETLERTEALITIVDAIMDRYDRAKTAQGLLDFDDLIDRTLTMLDRSDSGWVLHKLDAGIDHVLVDEAQDTSEAQWKILDRLTNDFASGATAQSTERSFFVVGDDKQSIFSFQGAAPLMFDQMRQHFERRFKTGRKAFERVSLKTSFRSVPGILSAVDTVFTTTNHQDGLVASGDTWPDHDSIKSRLPGLVEIWPRVGAVAEPDPQDWSIPIDTPPENDPVNIVADRVAKKIRSLLSSDSRDRVHDGRSDVARPIRAGDILILVRTRGAFFEAVIRALKRLNVPVAGADRLDVANHIAVMDLVAAGRAALLPADDLSLACVLKSPLFGLTDDDLIRLAPNRRGSLSAALAASSEPAHRAAAATLARWGTRAAHLTPFAFYVELLGRDGGRRLMEGRLGPEAHDAIDEFLRLALAHEQQGAPALSAFLADVESLESSIKRDMEAPGDTVRVMTVHAAKGLEAKVVFLPDTCAVPAPSLDPNVFDLDRETERPPLLVWSPRKGDDTSVVEEARARARQATLREYRRLLYVALTRAEERLYIAGFYNSREPPEDCWGAMIDRAFPDCDEVEAPWGNGDTIRRIASPGASTMAMAARDVAPQASLPFRPEWLSRPPRPSDASATLRPSRVARHETGSARWASGGDRGGRAYGIALHQLLQHLPDIAETERAATASALLAERKDLAGDVRDDLVAEALGVVAHPDLRALFGPGSRAEVAVAGRLTQGDKIRDVRGTLDRLVVTPRLIVVADFKSGPPIDPPPAAYVDQLALYRRLIAQLWPDHAVRMLLVWTKGPGIVELDADVLDRAAATILASA